MNDSYPDIIAEKFPQYEFVNAGINGYMTVDILGRIDNIVKCKPDLVTILLGSNDVNGSLPGRNKSYERSKYFPRAINNFWTLDRFVKDYSRIVEILKEKTDSKIALLSIPPVGEDPDSVQFKRSTEYCVAIKEIAINYDVSYLPVNEKMREYLDLHPSQSKLPFDKSQKLMIKAVFTHYLLGNTWDEISRKNNFSLLTDHLHLNNMGVSIIVDLVDGYIGTNLE